MYTLEDKNFLQSIKLEISKNFKLDPYERIAFHSIFSNLRTENDRNTLVKELNNEGHVKISAVLALSRFNDPDLSSVLKENVSVDSSPIELLAVLGYLKNNGTVADISYLIEMAENLKNINIDKYIILNIFEVLRVIGQGDANLYNFLKSQLTDSTNSEVYRLGAFNALSGFSNIDFFDEYISAGEENAWYIFQSIYKLNINLVDPIGKEKNSSTLSERYIDRPLNEYEELILKIKVFLGKSSSRFDSYSNDVKISYINALLSCNHRESNIFVLKALESGDRDLISMTLYSLYRNIHRLNLPEKLFRSLMALNVETEHDNDLVAEIIIRYFEKKNANRSDILFKEKEFGIISATLESYFETYRREFMIPDVMENAFPENFKKIRDFILRKLNPEYKRKLNMFLYAQGNEKSKQLINELSQWVYFVDENDVEALNFLIDIFIDEDPVSRENSANRIDSVNFEKRYLQSRIIRLCKIISALKIENASNSLVYIYNYLKKYPEPEIYEAATLSLCRLNYSYMLSEVEIMLSAGSPEDQLWAVKLLGIFTEKRLINILVEYLNANASKSTEIVREIAVIISGQNIKKNINAAEALKKIVESNDDAITVKYAILGIGSCGFQDDIDYLNQVYTESDNAKIKESVVKSISSIITINENINRQRIIKYSFEYLKDPSIKVRIFSCIVLLQLGEKEALKYIRDMLIIKNKSVQREILSILREIKSPDFYFFLVSLLRSEYAITKDIIGIITKLSADDLKEIDNFLNNLFRKFEIPVFENIPVKKEILNIDGVERVTKTVLFIKNEDRLDSKKEFSSYDNLKWNIIIDSLFIPPLKEFNGIISYKVNHDLTAIFNEAEDAVKAAMQIKERLNCFNRKTEIRKNIHSRISVSTGEISIINDEIFSPMEEDIIEIEGVPVLNRIIIDGNTARIIEEKYHFRSVPEILYSQGLSEKKHYEVLSEKTFIFLAMDIFNRKQEKIKEKHDLEKHIQEQVKNLSSESRSKTSISIASDLEDVGIKLRNQFNEIEKYVIGRSTDRELTKNVSKMLKNIYDLYRIEISKLTIK